MHMEPTKVEKQKIQQNLVAEEEKISGKVTFKDCSNYLGYSLGCCGILLYFLACSNAAVWQLIVGLFLAEWAS